MTKIDVLTNASKSVDIDYSAQIAVLEEKVADIYNVEEGLAQTKVKALINSKEIELLKVQLKELKISTSNPLSN
jgi:hypothetical protein